MLGSMGKSPGSEVKRNRPGRIPKEGKACGTGVLMTEPLSLRLEIFFIFFFFFFFGGGGGGGGALAEDL